VGVLYNFSFQYKYVIINKFISDDNKYMGIIGKIAISKKKMNHLKHATRSI